MPRTAPALPHVKVLLALLSILLLATCAQPPPLLDRILAEGELRVVTGTARTPITWAATARRARPMTLPASLPSTLGVPLRLYTVKTREAAIERGRPAGRAHIAAAGLSTGIALPRGVQFGPGYQRVRERLVYRRRSARPSTILDAGRGQIEVASASAHLRTLEDLRLRYPDLPWIERDDTDTEEILADVSQGRVQFTLASSTEFALNRSVHPELAIALDLSPERALSWVVSTTGQDSSLLNAGESFFGAARHEGVITALLDRYLTAKTTGSITCSRAISWNTWAPACRPTRPGSRKQRKKHAVDWRLLAAMGYQESKWDPHAVSSPGCAD